MVFDQSWTAKDLLNILNICEVFPHNKTIIRDTSSPPGDYVLSIKFSVNNTTQK